MYSPMIRAFFLLYQHSTLDTKNFYFHIYTFKFACLSNSINALLLFERSHFILFKPMFFL